MVTKRFPTKDPGKWAEIQAYLKEHHTYMTVRQMGAHFDVTGVAVCQWLKRLGIKKPMVRVPLPPELKHEIERLHDTGLPPRRIAKVLSTSRYTVTKYVHEHHPYRAHEFFFHTLTPESAYCLGFFYADGNLYRRRGRKDMVRFFQSNRPFLEMLQRTIGGGNVRAEGHEGAYVLRMCSDVMSAQLVRLGAVPRKSYKKLHIPRGIVGTLLPHFIRGFMDGDGCISFAHGCPGLSLVGGQTFLREIQGSIKEAVGVEGHLGIATRKGRRVSAPQGPSKATRNLYRLDFGKQRGLGKLLRWLYEGVGPCLARKQEKAREALACMRAA